MNIDLSIVRTAALQSKMLIEGETVQKDRVEDIWKLYFLPNFSVNLKK